MHEAAPAALANRKPNGNERRVYPDQPIRDFPSGWSQPAPVSPVDTGFLQPNLPMVNSAPHLQVPEAAATALRVSSAFRPQLRGQTGAYFDDPRLPDARVESSGNGSWARYHQTRAPGAGDGTHVTFEARGFSARATEDDPCVLGRLSIEIASPAVLSVPSVAQLNLTLFLAEPQPAIILLTRLVMPVGWSPAAPGVPASFDAPRMSGPASFLAGGQLVHVHLEPPGGGLAATMNPWHQGWLRFTFGPAPARRLLHGVVAVRVKYPVPATESGRVSDASGTARTSLLPDRRVLLRRENR
jgi:hypothetical protein